MDNNKNEAANKVAKANNDFKGYMMQKVSDIAVQSGSALTASDRNFAQEIILSTYKKMIEDEIDPNKVNFIGCNFPGQVKRYSRLGLTVNNSEIWIDIRNNKKSQKKDINIKIQYQGEEKLITKFCKKGDGIYNIYKDVVMEGEDFVTSFDFKTGNRVIADHKIPDVFHRNISIANKDKVIGAYAIAYHNDGTQTPVIIDKDRIDRAMNAAMTKNVWNSDYKKMVIKTVVHELYKDLAKFIVVPDDLLNDYQEMMLNKEEVQSEINQNANSEVFEANFNIKEENQNTSEQPVSSQHKIIESAGEVETNTSDQFIQMKAPF
jgi:recombinational DNA repair protein RecT